jgi:apolipoprotein N-acyltransferase
LSLLKKIGYFFIPEDIDLRKRRLELLVWAFLLSFSFYPYYFGFLAWFSLVRPLMIISSLKGRQAFNAAFFFSFFLNLFLIYWIGMVTLPGMISAVILVAFYNTAVFMLFIKIYNIKKLYAFIIMPFLWIGMEYFRTLTEFSFAWSDLGYSQSFYLPIMQIVSITSVHGLSFLIIVVNILLWQVFRKSLKTERKLTAIFISIAVLFSLWAYGWVITPKYPTPGEHQVTLLQGSVPIEVKWKKGNAWYSYNLYDSLSNSAVDSNTELFIWPETSAPSYLSHDANYRRFVGQIAVNTDAYHLVGALGAKTDTEKQRYFNSAYLISPDGAMELRYDKVKLVPFSEHVPYQDYFPFLEKSYLQDYLTFIETYNVQWWSDFYPGDSIKLFNLPDYTFSLLICFESTFPEFVRETILKGADFIVGITNDTWFGKSVGIHQHSRIFITRCIENRSWGVRVANSGLTYVVDNYGRIRSELGIYEVGVLTEKVSSIDEYSLFTRYGDLIGLTSFLITISLGCIFIFIWLLKKTFLRKSQ